MVVAPQVIRPAAPAPSRMTLDRVTRGRLTKAPRILIHGVEGVGKTTFAANAPRPIFLPVERGSDKLDVARFPRPETWQDARDAVAELMTADHDYQTFVIDTVDWLEPLCWRFICERDGKADIEAYGYGKGYTAALPEWRLLVADLERLNEERDMTVILLAHSFIRPFKNPEGDDYDRYSLKLHEKASGLLREWAELIGFANFETVTKKDGKTKRIRGVSTGARWLYTTHSAAYDAKNRYNLPEVMPLDWTEVAAAIESHTPADPEVLLGEITRKAAELSDKDAAMVATGIGRANGNPEKLAQLNSWINAKLAMAASEQGGD